MKSDYSLIFLLLCVFASGTAMATDDLEDLVRINEVFQMKIVGLETDGPVNTCFVSSIAFKADNSQPEMTKARVLCDTSRGKIATYWKFGLTTGISETLLVDVDSDSWLKIVDTPQVEPRKADESTQDWGARLKDTRDHVIEVETSTRLFDPYDGEVTDEARSVLWEGLGLSDPELADFVVSFLEDFGGCRNPHFSNLVSRVENSIYDGGHVSSPQIEMKRVRAYGENAAESEKNKDKEVLEFEEGFGKWGTSFPDPPKLD